MRSEVTDTKRCGGDDSCALCLGAGYVRRFRGGDTNKKCLCPCIEGGPAAETLKAHGLLEHG